MSDYLGHLLAKSLNLTEVVQPRPVSLFEPSPMERMAAHPFSEPEGVIEIEEGRETAVPTPPSLSSPHQLLSPIGPESTLPMSPQRPTPPMLPTEQPVYPARPLQTAVTPLNYQSAPTAVPTHIQPIPDPLLAPSHTETPVAPLPPHRELAQQSEQTTIIREIVTERVISPAQPMPSTVMPQAHTAVMPTPIKPLHLADETPSSTAPSPKTHSAIAITPAQIRPYGEPKTVPPATPEPAPVIQVTIGRIEVRATPPARATARKERSPSSVMTLEEYLRQRNGGK